MQTCAAGGCRSRSEEKKKRGSSGGGVDMGKHNGKSRNKGLVVGSALLKRKMGGGKTNQGRKAEDAGSRHTTDMGGPNNTQSIVEMNDLDELMNMVSFLSFYKKEKRERESMKHLLLLLLLL